MKRCICTALVSLLICTVVWGQATAQIHGIVRDPSGAAVPGAEVKVTQTDTGFSRSVLTREDGSYILTSLPVGTYQLEVSIPGFVTYAQRGIVLQVDADPAIDAVLMVGSVTEQLLVQADVTQVETRSSGVGEVVQTQRIVDLPLNGRNVTDLITLSGAAVNSGLAPNRYFANLPRISIAGQPQSTNGGTFGTDYLLDGANHLNYITGGSMPIAFPDAVQEFKVESSGQTAQRGSSASVVIVTRSGSNTFQGSLFEFIRNSGFGSAREYFSTTKTVLKRHQFGGTLGGPIQKNKLFFFGGFQGTTIRSNPGNSIATVPTADMLAGNWTDLAACNGLSLGAPFSSNRISAAAYSPPAVYIANKLRSSLTANGITPDRCGRVTYDRPAAENDYQLVGKIDYQRSDKQSLFFRFLDTPLKVFNGQSINPNLNLLAMDTYGSGSLAQSYAIGHTYVINPSLIQSFHLSFERTSGFRTKPNHFFDWCDAGVNIYCGYSPDPGWFGGITAMAGGFILGTGGGGSPNGFSSTLYALNDDVGYVRGPHQMNFGAGAYRGQHHQFISTTAGGQFAFQGQVPGIQSGMAEFFLGIPSTFVQSRPAATQNTQNVVNVYFTDSWKLSPRLTFNYGIRWQPFLPQIIPNDHVTNFDMNRFLQGASARSTVFKNAPFGIYYPGDSGFPGKSGIYTRWIQFMPRGGLAWDPTGSGQMSLRAGYAFGYAYLPSVSRPGTGVPWQGNITIQSPASLVNPWGNVQGGNPFPYEITPNVVFPPLASFNTNRYDMPTPNTYSWNVSFQRQFGADWVASATYLGSRVIHLYVGLALNYAPLVPGPIGGACAATATNCNAASNIQARRVLSLLNPSQGQLISNLTDADPSGTQSYHGLLASVQKRFSRGISVNANWTWSHCTVVGAGSVGATSTVPNNPLFDRGNCDIDRRHIVNLTAVTQTPQFSHRVLSIAASNWQLSGIYRFSSGVPLGIISNVDRQLTGIANQRPNLIGNPYTGKDGPSGQYLNKDAFALPALGTIGNLGYNALVGPTAWGLDLALSRQFRIVENQVLEIRADAFNFTNSFVSAVTATGSNGTAQIGNFVNFNNNQLFGQILSAQPARQIQFAMKYRF